MGSISYSAFDILRKDILFGILYLTEHLIFDWQYKMYLNRNQLSFLLLCFVFKYLPKINFMGKMGLTYAISVVIWIFGISLLKHIFAFIHWFKIIDVP